MHKFRKGDAVRFVGYDKHKNVPPSNPLPVGATLEVGEWAEEPDGYYCYDEQGTRYFLWSTEIELVKE